MMLTPLTVQTQEALRTQALVGGLPRETGGSIEARVARGLGTRVVRKGRDIHRPHHVLLGQQLVAFQRDLQEGGMRATVLPGLFPIATASAPPHVPAG